MPIPALVDYPALKYLPHALLAGLVIYLGSQVYNHIYESGQNSVQVKWNKEKAKQASVIKELQAKYDKLESKHIQETERIKHELNQSNEKYQYALSRVKSDYNIRLQTLSQRADKYQRLAQAGTAECGSLAGITTEFDRTLERGRSLVRELRETLGFRDEQLILVGSQLLSDRALLEKAGEND